MKKYAGGDVPSNYTKKNWSMSLGLGQIQE
jgi:hypothetical protein